MGSTKNDIDPGLIALFRDSDRMTLRESDGAEMPPGSYEAFLEELDDIDDADEDSLSVVYRAPIHIIRDRLQVLGYSLKNCREIFEAAVRHEIQNNERRLKEATENEKSNRSDFWQDFYEGQCEVLRQLSVDNWLEKMRKIRTDRLDKDLPGVRLAKGESHPDPVIAYMLRTDWYGFPGPDTNVAIRLALEACTDADEMLYDISDLVAGGYFSSIENLVESSVGIFEDEHRSAAKIIILTEGKSDARILADSISLLYPHLAEYYSFMEFDAVRFGGGAGNLVNILKAFAGAGVANRTIGLFDNDTAAAAALHSLKNVQMPSHIRIMKLPEIDFLKSYPTIGPSGPLHMDVNGIAASIELFLGEDVLRESGELVPVQWTGYDWKLGRYQGEVGKKELIHRRFYAKVARARCNVSSLDDPAWEPLRNIFGMIFHGFDDYERGQILSVINNYYN